MQSPTRRLAFGLALVASLLVAQPGVAAPKKSKRHGIEGRVVNYLSAQDQLVVSVSKTKVSGGAGSGGVAGEPAPKTVKPGSELTFVVVPEGSVLKRTVIKSVKGGGLNKGTRESFEAALAAIPGDRDVIFSFEANPAGKPEYVLKMIQIRMTEEELEARFNEISVEE